MSFDHINLDPHQLLNAAVESLNACFFASQRAPAKTAFLQLHDGEAIQFMRIGSPENGEVEVRLTLDKSEHVGALSFGQFRKGLAMLLLNLKRCVDDKLNANPLYSDTGDVLFNLPGVVETGLATNVLVAGLSQAGPGRAVFKLMYLNPDEYIKAAATAAGVDSK